MQNIAIHFYPRPPRGGRLQAFRLPCRHRSFLSTPSARRATLQSTKPAEIRSYFYPRPPRGGRLSYRLKGIDSVIFLSTPSARRATTCGNKILKTMDISIHALREEGDPQRLLFGLTSEYFYPRPPRGGRQQKQRENPLLLSHYTPPCTNCKEVPVKQTAESHCYLCKRLVFRCEASGKTMCAACSHWRGIKRSAHYPAQTPGAAQHARP